MSHRARVACIVSSNFSGRISIIFFSTIFLSIPKEKEFRNRFRWPSNVASRWSSFLLEREVIILNSCIPSHSLPRWTTKKRGVFFLFFKKTRGTVEMLQGKKCRSIYIIINRKEIYLTLQAKYLLFSLQLIWIHSPRRW